MDNRKYEKVRTRLDRTFGKETGRGTNLVRHLHMVVPSTVLQDCSAMYIWIAFHLVLFGTERPSHRASLATFVTFPPNTCNNHCIEFKKRDSSDQRQWSHRNIRGSTRHQSRGAVQSISGDNSISYPTGIIEIRWTFKSCKSGIDGTT